MSLLEGIIDSPNNPLAVVEDIAASNNWSFERSGEDEVTIVSKGDWTDYQLSFTWMNEIEALHLACAFDMKIPGPRRAEVQRLIAAIRRCTSARRGAGIFMSKAQARCSASISVIQVNDS